MFSKVLFTSFFQFRKPCLLWFLLFESLRLSNMVLPAKQRWHVAYISHNAMPKIINRFHTLVRCISSTSQKKTALGHAREPLTLPLNFIEPAILLHPELFENKVA